MNRRSFFSALATLSGAGCTKLPLRSEVPVPTPAYFEKPAFSISGQVVAVGRQIDDLPLAEATVMLESIEEHPLGFPIAYTEGEIVTGSKGRFYFPDLPEGNYRIRLYYQDSEEDTVELKLNKDTSITLQVRW